MSFTRPYGYKEGTFLYEQDRLRSCGLPKVPINGKIAGNHKASATVRLTLALGSALALQGDEHSNSISPRLNAGEMRYHDDGRGKMLCPKV